MTDYLSRPPVFYDHTYFLSNQKYVIIGIGVDFEICILLVNTYAEKFIKFSLNEFEILLCNLSFLISKVKSNVKDILFLSEYKTVLVDSKKLILHDQYRQVKIKLSFYEIQKLFEMKQLLEYIIGKVSFKEKYMYRYFNLYVEKCVKENVEKLNISCYSDSFRNLFPSKKAFYQFPLIFLNRLQKQIEIAKEKE